MRYIHSDDFGVEWDSHINGHDLFGYAPCKDGHGWFVDESDIECYSSNVYDDMLVANDYTEAELFTLLGINPS